MIYVIVAVWIWFVGGLFRYNTRLGNRERRKKFLVAACFAVFLLQALRGESVGADTGTYLRRFAAVQWISWKEIISFQWYIGSFEFGYVMLEKIVHLFTNNAQWIVVVCAAIYMRCIYKFILEESNDYFIAITVALGTGLVLAPMNLMRQGLAIGICCLGWIQWQQNNKLKACGLVLVAMTFHLSAILFFLLYLTRYVPAKRWLMLVAFLFFGVVFVFGDEFIRFVVRYFPAYYARYGWGRWSISSARGIIILWAIIGAIIIKCLFTINWADKENHRKFEILFLSAAYLCICAMGRSFDGFERIGLYFEPFLILLFEEGSVFKRRELRSLYRFGVAVCMTLLWIRSASSEQYLYSFFWQ